MNILYLQGDSRIVMSLMRLVMEPTLHLHRWILKYQDIFLSLNALHTYSLFTFKKHRSMHVCNQITKVTKVGNYLLDS
jgi:hypothetical protein